MEFKVGQRVRIRQWDDMVKEFGTQNILGTIAIRCKNTFPERMKHLCGKSATIKEFYGDIVDLADWQEDAVNYKCWSFSLDMLEPVFKVGDRVRLLDKADSCSVKAIGEIGTVIEMDNSNWVTIEFDKDIDGHSRSGKGKWGHCWNFKVGSAKECSNIEIIHKEKRPAFKVGDIVRGIHPAMYNITNTKMMRGKIKEVYSPTNFSVEILEHENSCHIGRTFDGLNSRFFELATDTPEKIVITQGDKTVWAKLQKDGVLVKESVAKCHPDDEFDFLKGAAIAIERLRDQPEVKRYAKVGEWVRVTGKDGHSAKVDEIVKVTGMTEKEGWVWVKTSTGEETVLRDTQYVVLEGYKPQTEKPKFYNGKVVCVDNCGNRAGYTIGKIYQFVDGVITMDTGSRIGEDCRFTSLKDFQQFTSSKFIEIID